jgi:hypothetical protein
MDKKILKEIALQAGGSHYPEVGGATLEKFAELLIEACIEAVENTGTQHAFTTFDKGMIDATIDKCAQSIRDTFDVPLVRKMPHENRTSK